MTIEDKIMFSAVWYYFGVGGGDYGELFLQQFCMSWSPISCWQLGVDPDDMPKDDCELLEQDENVEPCLPVQPTTKAPPTGTVTPPEVFPESDSEEKSEQGKSEEAHVLFDDNVDYDDDDGDDENIHI